VLNQPGLSSDYLVRLRELMLVFGKTDKRLWPVMYYLENHPRAFKVWHSARVAADLSRRAPRKLHRMYNSRKDDSGSATAAG
jgi:hypothetical protein